MVASAALKGLNFEIVNGQFRFSENISSHIFQQFWTRSSNKLTIRTHCLIQTPCVSILLIPEKAHFLIYVHWVSNWENTQISRHVTFHKLLSLGSALKNYFFYHSLLTIILPIWFFTRLMKLRDGKIYWKLLSKFKFAIRRI